MNIWVTAGGYIMSFVLGALLLKAHQDIGEQIGQCNADKAEAVATATELVRQREREHAQAVLDAQEVWANRTITEVQNVAEARIQAAERSAESERAIFQTTLERFDEDLPDSGACLSVFVLDRDVDGMRP
jgi:hypothetical protein